MSIWYEPHPVSPARKAELRAKGYKIIDERFAPADWRPYVPQAADQAETLPPVKRRGRKPKMEVL